MTPAPQIRGTAAPLAAVALAVVLLALVNSAITAGDKPAAGGDFVPASLASPGSWQARPDWIGNAAEERGVDTTADGLDFWVRGAGLAMKWTAPLDQPVDAETTPWLIFRYRCRDFRADLDYLLWLGVEGQPDGVNALTPGQFVADGKWHTLALDLQALGCGVVSSVAVQCRAAGAEGHLDVAELRFAETAPAGAEVFPPPAPLKKLRDYDLGAASSWQAQPGWLSDPSSQYEAARTATGLRFSVQGRGLGMKFSHSVAKPLPAGYYRIRYRARGVASSSTDYAFYAANAPGGQAPEEQYVFTRSQIIADGQPHVLVGHCKIDGANTLAVQVQVAPGASSGWIELGPLEVWSRRPPTRLEDLVTAATGWPADMKTWRPVELAAGADKATAAGLLGAEGWWPAEKIRVQGVPFLVRDGHVLTTGRAELGSVEVPIGERARQLYLLLGAWMPTQPLPGYSPESSGVITAPYHFVCEIHYRGGAVEQQIPTVVGLGSPEVRRGVGVYALAVDHEREIDKIVLVDGSRRAAFLLYGVTASSEKGPATAVTAPVRAPEVRPRRRLSDACRVDTSRAGHVTVDAGALHIALTTGDGLQFGGITSDYVAGVPTLAWIGSVFSVKVGQVEVRSADAKVTGVRQTGPASAVVDVDLRPALPIQTALTVTARPDDEVLLGLDLEPSGGGLGPTGKLAEAPIVELPTLVGCKATSDPAHTWVFYPGRGADITDRPFRRSEPYSGIFPLQVMGVYSQTGGGLYVRTEYTDPFARRYEADHGDSGVALDVLYPFWRGEKLNAVLGTEAGDWHGQLAAYERWRKTWFKPLAPRKSWFRRVFNFRQEFINYPMPQPSGMFDPATKTFHFEQALEADEKAFGGVDYLHLFDWGWSPKHGRCGDYAPWDYLGGVDNFRRAVEGVEKSGIPVGLYLEGYLVSPQSTLFDRAKAWQVITASGKPLDAFAPSIDMCPWVKPWQDYLSSVYGRVHKQTGAMGFYIDEYGFAGDNHECFSRDHGHPSPVYAAKGELEMTRKIRAALGPDAVIYTEESPCDVTQQVQDGSFTYAITTTAGELNPSHLNTTRFAAPGFKTIEILFCDHPTRDDLEDLGNVLFNGEAIWLEGTPDAWFAPRALAFIRHMHSILRAEADCFTSLTPEALVPTMWQGLYANRFPSADGKRCVWTLSWKGARTLAGDLLAVPHVDGAKYRELWAGRPLKVRRDGDRDILGGTINPHEVLVILQEAKR